MPAWELTVSREEADTQQNKSLSPIGKAGALKKDGGGVQGWSAGATQSVSLHQQGCGSEPLLSITEARRLWEWRLLLPVRRRNWGQCWAPREDGDLQPVQCSPARDRSVSLA